MANGGGLICNGLGCANLDCIESNDQAHDIAGKDEQGGDQRHGGHA